MKSSLKDDLIVHSMPKNGSPTSASALPNTTPIPSVVESEACTPPILQLPYSTFSKRQKWLIIFLSTFAASFSPLSSFIFFPAITSLSEALDVSISKINLTITSYMIIAAIAPAILGDLADTIGRRPVYLVMLGVYLCANVGLAVQRNWAALFVLRMVQSFGSAATIAVGYGIVADIATPAERGEFVSSMVLGPNIATAVGPILGGALAESPGWRWIFWLLSILSGMCLLAIALLLPETARSVVGNGQVVVSGIRQTLLSSISSRKSSSVGHPPGDEKHGPKQAHEFSGRKGFHIPNPTTSLKLLLAPDCFLIILIFGVFYMNLSCLQATMSPLFVRIYRISEIKAGLVYLPSGIGSIVGAYGAGYILRYDYSITARKHNITINVHGGDDMATFPIEEARLRSVRYTIIAASVCTIGYGWALQYRTHMVVPLLLQFIIGFSTAVVFNTSGTLLTDVHPKSPSTASAANSIVRCLLAGGGTALVQTFIDSIGVQWTFTLFGCLGLGCLVISWLERRFGKLWRDGMREKGIER
ncbi:major facilitator superfamily domain-containing protein [Pyrenochaeta sp. MPI-SDFR-AT-0127]|nr:major facilitator superfamily domain-containing protein [Pyrenochaeta sp. MPI-SDFR-AT-0127]